jgi:hypothetical protein
MVAPAPWVISASHSASQDGHISPNHHPGAHTSPFAEATDRTSEALLQAPSMGQGTFATNSCDQIWGRLNARVTNYRSVRHPRREGLVRAAQLTQQGPQQPFLATRVAPEHGALSLPTLPAPNCTPPPCCALAYSSPSFPQGPALRAPFRSLIKPVRTQFTQFIPHRCSSPPRHPSDTN